MRSLDTYDNAFEKLQTRYDNGIEIVPVIPNLESVDADAHKNRNLEHGFIDISARAGNLVVLAGRVLLMIAEDRGSFNPAVITKTRIQQVNGSTIDGIQISKLAQPYDPKKGLTDGILFGLGLKTETNSPSFGSHTAAGGLESGHLAPVFVAAKDSVARDSIQQKGDVGTHSIGKDVGGVPEKMIDQKMLPEEVRLHTVQLTLDDKRVIPVYWHQSLQTNEGMAAAHFDRSATRLMLGAASIALGEKAVDQVGDLIDQSVRSR